MAGRLAGKRILVTAAGAGIGRATVLMMAAEGAQVIATDVKAELLDALAGVAGIETRRLDVLFNCAGWVHQGGIEQCTDADWDLSFNLNVRAQWKTIAAALPGMLERGSGCLVNVASAAGLLSQTGDTPYSATKHAAVGLAESLAITYGDRGIQVSVICPQYVATAIIGADEGTAAGSMPGVLTVEQAATAIADGIEQGRFLILTHAEVLGFFQRKASDYDRWLGGMRRLRDGLRSGGFLKTKS